MFEWFVPALLGFLTSIVIYLVLAEIVNKD